MIESLAETGIDILITRGLRKEQDPLFAKGRTAPLGHDDTVTNARGGQSHNFGLALDIVVLDAHGKADWDRNHSEWAAAAKVGTPLGLDWGGDGTGFKNIPHYRYTNDLPLQRWAALYVGGSLRFGSRFDENVARTLLSARTWDKT